ncbi:hypothetical protein, partial [Faecalibaculum rodentium]|uniref:hypothetical protein n=1 Tax=Faecalibaculum rodentium TaxID=1702221 RepID=UPI0023F40D56
MEEETFPFVPFFCRLSSNCGNFADMRRKNCLERLYRRLCKRKRKLDRLPSSVNGLSRINSASNNAILESGREAPYVQEIAV